MHGREGQTMTEPKDANRLPGDPPYFYTHHVFVCTNRRPDGHKRGSCGAKGSEAIRDYMKVRAKELGLNLTRINTSGCLDRCEEGPCVLIYPEGIWYRAADRTAADRILESLQTEGGRVPELMLPPGTAGSK